MSGAKIIVCSQDCCFNSTSHIDMIVLKHDHIKQSIPVIGAASNQNGPFFSKPKIGSSFTRIQQLTVCAADQVYQMLCFGGNAAHSLHTIQNQSFCHKD